MNRVRTSVSAPIARALALTCIASFAAGPAQSQNAAGALAGLAPTAATGFPARPVVSVQIDGRITAAGGKNEHEVEFAAGQHFNATISVPAGGKLDRTVDVRVFRKHRVTGELSDIYGGSAEFRARDARPLSTGVISVNEKGVFVVRVSSDAVGPYSLVVAPLDRGPISLDRAVQDSLVSVSGMRDYVLSARAGEPFNVTIAAPAMPNPDRSLSAEIFRKHRVTGELSDIYGGDADLRVRDGEPMATGVVNPAEAGDYVIRIYSDDVGPYTLTAQRLARGVAELGRKAEGSIVASNDLHDYAFSVRRGQSFTVVLEAPYTGNADRTLSVEIFRKHRVTGELSDIYGGDAELRVRDGEPVATGTVTATEGTDFVIRVHSPDVGPYSITPRASSAR